MCSAVEKADSGKALSPDEEGFVSLFDGHSLSGWRKLTEYSGESGKWEVKDGAIVGDQYPEGEGGLLVTEARFGDFELMAEVKADYPIDSGIFLRVQPDVLSYQVTIDYRPDGEVAAIYCPGGGGFLVHKPEGKDLWKAGAFNAVRVRIQGQPAHIQVWLNGTALVDFFDRLVDGKARVPADGYVGIQVHPGSSWGKGNKVYFRRLEIKPLR
jgi:hypothetical protein